MLQVQYFNYVNYWVYFYSNNNDYSSYGYGYYNDYGSLPDKSGYDNDGSQYSDLSGADDTDYEGDDGSDDGGGDDGGGDDGGGDDGGGDGGGDDKKRSILQQTNVFNANSSYYYRPVYTVNLTAMNGTVVQGINATNDHLNNGWVPGSSVSSSVTNSYPVNGSFPCWYNNKGKVLPAGENYVYFNYDVSQREKEFLGFMITGVILFSLGAIAIVIGSILCHKNGGCL